MNLSQKLKDEFSRQVSSNANLTSQPGGTFEIAKAIGEFNEEERTENLKRKPLKKSKTKELVSKTKMNLPIGKLMSIGPVSEEDSEMTEKWSEKYKKSIDCKNPKGFSQRAHCQGKHKKETKEATGSGSAGGFLGPVGFNPKSDFVKKSFNETPKKVKTNGNDNITKVETKEATGSGSAGSYVTPAAWAKSTKKKDWRGKSKTQIPGGKFVQVKKKCKTFPYCNQGDINALKIFENESMKKVIQKISEEKNISEDVIKNIIIFELYSNKKRIQ
jgi:hypothetical protein